jgi:hypothetical protein
MDAISIHGWTSYPWMDFISDYIYICIYIYIAFICIERGEFRMGRRWEGEGLVEEETEAEARRRLSLSLSLSRSLARSLSLSLSFPLSRSLCRSLSRSLALSLCLSRSIFIYT